MEMIPCHADDCLAMLCEECHQFICDGCGLIHCLSHRIQYSGLDLCPVCMADLVASDAADLELASQPEAGFVRACAEAGCTLSEVQALAKEIQ